MTNPEDQKVTCEKCGREHTPSLSNCCWIHCSCGTKICGRCGSMEIVIMDINQDDPEADYWCCQECADCGLQGCGLCI